MWSWLSNVIPDYMFIINKIYPILCENTWKERSWEKDWERERDALRDDMLKRDENATQFWKWTILFANEYKKNMKHMLKAKRG